MKNINLFKQVKYYFPGQIYPALLNMILILFLTRHLTVEGYGEYNLLISTVGLFVTLLTSWLTQSVLYYYPIYVEALKEDIFISKLVLFQKSLIILSFIISGMLVLVSILFFAKNFDEVVLIPIVILIICFQSLYTIRLNLHRIKFENKLYLRLIMLSVSLKVFSIISLEYFFDLNLITLFFAILASYIIILSKYITELFLNKNKSIKSEKTNDFFRQMFRYGMPILGMGICSSIMVFIERFSLGTIHSNYEVGLYSGNMSVVTSAISLVFLPLTMAIHPILMKLSASADVTNNILSKKIREYTSVYFIVGIPIILLIIRFKNEISEILLGASYSEASGVIAIGVIGVFLWNLCTIGHKAFEMKKETFKMLRYLVTSTFIGIFFGLILTWKFSYIGTSFSPLITYFVYMMLVKYNSKEIIWSFDWKKILYYIFTGLGALLLVESLFGQGSKNIFYLISYSLIFLLIYLVFLYVDRKLLKI